MTIDTDLARLTAGLDRDAEIARAIDDKQLDSGWSVITYPGNSGRWISPHIGQVHEVEAAEHIVRHDPDRVLNRYIPAIRKVLAEHEPNQDDLGIWFCPTCSDCKPPYHLEVVERFPCPTVRALAGIYEEQS